MTRLLRIAAAALLGAALLACQKDPDAGITPEQPTQRTGRLEVAVLPESGVPTGPFSAGPYFIYTLPATRTVWSDSSGKAVLDSVPPGRYHVRAVGYGQVAQSLAIVRGSDSVPVDLTVTQGHIGPLLHFSQLGFYVHQGDSLRISVWNRKWKAGDSTLTLEMSNTRGLRAEAEIRDSTGATLSLGPLTLDDTLFTILYRSAGGDPGVTRVKGRVDSMPSPKLTARWDGKAVVLTWNRFHGSGFLAYKLSASSNDYLQPAIPFETDNPDDTVFRDENPAPAESLKYTIQVYNRNANVAVSPVAALAQPGIRNFRAGPLSLFHPTQPWIYTSSQNQLYRYDYQTGKSDSVPLTSASGYLDIGDNGSGVELYIPLNAGTGGRVLIMDAATLDTVGSINAFSTVSSVASSGKGRLMISARTPYSLMEVDRKTLGVLSGSRGGYQYRLRYLPDGVKAVGLAVDLSPVYAFLIETAAVRPEELPGARNIVLDPRNFQVSPDGSALVSGDSGYVRRLDATFAGLGALPPDTAGYACFAFSPEGDRLYAGVRGQRRIRVFTFPGLATLQAIPTRGMPENLVMREGRLLSLSATNRFSGLYLLEQLTP